MTRTFFAAFIFAVWTFASSAFAVDSESLIKQKIEDCIYNAQSSDVSKTKQICTDKFKLTQAIPPPDDMRAGPNRPGWLVDDRSGCWVWDAVPQSGETVTWSGGCSADGRATGRGVLEWHFDGKISRFEGDYRDGKANGRGVEVWANGNRYEGEWRDGKKNGRGIFVWVNGDRYDGEWLDNDKTGHGIFVWVNGNRYEGEYRDNKASGYGTLRTVNGKIYSGNWIFGCFQGNEIAWAGTTREECQRVVTSSSFDGIWTGSGTCRGPGTDVNVEIKDGVVSGANKFSPEGTDHISGTIRTDGALVNGHIGRAVLSGKFDGDRFIGNYNGFREGNTNCLATLRLERQK